MHRAVKVVLPLVLLAILPTAAYADAGTPLMIAGLFHLVIGNFFIGVGETLVFAVLFRRQSLWSFLRFIRKCLKFIVDIPIFVWLFIYGKRQRSLQLARQIIVDANDNFQEAKKHNREGPPLWICFVIIIAANYFSAWIGMIVLAQSADTLKYIIDIGNVKRWLTALIIASFLLTLLLEWPFVAACFWKSDRWVRKSIWADLAMQAASYLVLLGWYSLFCRTSLLTDVAIVPLPEIQMPAILLYYVDPNSRDIFALDAVHSRKETIGVMPVADEKQTHRLTAEKSNANADRIDLLVRRDYWLNDDKLPKLEDIAVLPSFALSESAWEKGDRTPSPAAKRKSEWWAIPQYLPTDKRSDLAESNCGGDWYELQLTSKKGEGKLQLAFEVPFLNWNASCVALLPNSQVILNIGDGQLCILDFKTRRIAILAKGRYPVVTLTEGNR
jgi:hypothetical protein